MGRIRDEERVEDHRHVLDVGGGPEGVDGPQAPAQPIWLGECELQGDSLAAGCVGGADREGLPFGGLFGCAEDEVEAVGLEALRMRLNARLFDLDGIFGSGIISRVIRYRGR